MADPFYVLRYTDPGKTPFVVNPSMADGPESPNTLAFPPGVVSANTTLLLLGRGRFDYGQPIQQDLIYMLEHFANSTAPTYPIEGQLWYNNASGRLSVYDGGVWRALLVSGAVDANIDMSSFRIVNLGSPVGAGDAVPLGYANTTYVNAAGDTMTGSLTMSGASSHVILPNPPSDGLHAINRDYFDSEVDPRVAAEVADQISALAGSLPATYVAKAGDVMTGSLQLSSGNIVISTGNFEVTLGNVTVPIGNVIMSAGDILMQNGNITATNGSLTLGGGNLSVGGTTMLMGSATFAAGADFTAPVTVTNTTLTLVGGSSQINMSSNRIVQLGEPVAGTDAATRNYVDSAVSGGTGDGVVFAGDIDPDTGSITLNRTLSLPDVVLTGTAAPYDHRHRFRRELFTSDGVQTTYNTAAPFIFGFHHLEVFVDGVKQIASQAATGLITPDSPRVITDDTDLEDLTSYSINLTVNGTLYTDFTVNIPAVSIVTYRELIDQLNLELVALSIPAVAAFFDGAIQIMSSLAGVGSSVTIAPPSSGTDLLASFDVTVTVTNSTIATDYGYREVGTAYANSTQFILASAPMIGAVIEVKIPA